MSAIVHAANSDPFLERKSCDAPKRRKTLVVYLSISNGHKNIIIILYRKQDLSLEKS